MAGHFHLTAVTAMGPALGLNGASELGALIRPQHHGATVAALDGVGLNAAS